MADTDSYTNSFKDGKLTLSQYGYLWLIFRVAFLADLRLIYFFIELDNSKKTAYEWFEQTMYNCYIIHGGVWRPPR